MRIVDETEIPKVHNGRKTLNTPERWVLGKEGKKVRISILSKLDVGKAAIVTLGEFETNKKSVRNFDTMLNQVFIVANLPLIARRAGEEIIIRKMATFDLSEYNKGDKKELKKADIELLKSKLAEVIDMPSWGPED